MWGFYLLSKPELSVKLVYDYNQYLEGLQFRFFFSITKNVHFFLFLFHLKSQAMKFKCLGEGSNVTMKTDGTFNMRSLSSLYPPDAEKK